MSTVRIENGTVITLGAKNRVLHGYDLICEKGLVKAVVPHGTDAGPADRVIDARGRLVMPGFINAHMHFYSTLVRGLGKAEPSRDFREVLEHLWWRLDRKLDLEDCRLSALVALIDAVRHGTTTLIDHHASPNAIDGVLDVLAEEVERTGVRASLAYEVSDRDGEAIACAGLAENVRFARRCAAERNPHLRAHFGLHASFTLGDATLERAATRARELGVGCHVHVAEAESDQVETGRMSGMRVVERLHAFGVLGPRTIAAHGVHLSEHEMELLAVTGTALVHNPQSNMNNAVGVAAVPRMVEKGVLVGLGTDAMTVDMREEVRAALWVRHLAERNPSVGFMETLSTLVVNNARIANRVFDPPIGALEQGHAADVVILDYHPPTPLDESTFLGHLGFGLALARVDTTIVGGRVLMEDSRLLLDLDEAEVAARSRERAKALWERF